MSKAVLRHSRLWGNIARLPLSVLYDDYQQDGARRRRPFYAPPPRLTRVTPPAARTRPLPTAIDRGFLLSCFFFVTGCETWQLSVTY
ncbi:unnamed protein product [Brassica rapa]|uniref:Uncharacterized protein n=1 Tax=Brassica campestris TaxID=3711 RepID=A0A8D9HE04_BRACM|nr:unnamed protein product [Brassica rapa]